MAHSADIEKLIPEMEFFFNITMFIRNAASHLVFCCFFLSATLSKPLDIQTSNLAPLINTPKLMTSISLHRF